MAHHSQALIAQPSLIDLQSAIKRGNAQVLRTLAQQVAETDPTSVLIAASMGMEQSTSHSNLWMASRSIGLDVISNPTRLRRADIIVACQTIDSFASDRAWADGIMLADALLDTLRRPKAPEKLGAKSYVHYATRILEILDRTNETAYHAGVLALRKLSDPAPVLSPAVRFLAAQKVAIWAADPRIKKPALDLMVFFARTDRGRQIPLTEKRHGLTYANVSYPSQPDRDRALKLLADIDKRNASNPTDVGWSHVIRPKRWLLAAAAPRV